MSISRTNFKYMYWSSVQQLVHHACNGCATLPNGEQRSFLKDDDTLTITGWCQGEGYRVGFGHVEGTIRSS